MIKNMTLGFFFLTSIFALCVRAEDLSQTQKQLEQLQGPIPDIMPEGGFVPTKEVAAKIAEVILKPIFKEKLKDEIPFSVSKKEDVWIIEGRERSKCKSNDAKCFQLDGSAVHLEIDDRDARVIKLYKYK